MEEKKVFVPYRGFYFLNKNRRYNELCEFVFSSPIGAFIFLMEAKREAQIEMVQFSSPIGAFIFLIEKNRIIKNFKGNQFSSPIGAFIFLILVLQSLYLCGLKRCFAV